MPELGCLQPRPVRLGDDRLVAVLLPIAPPSESLFCLLVHCDLDLSTRKQLYQSLCTTRSRIPVLVLPQNQRQVRDWR
jgi:hypothetical protein